MINWFEDLKQRYNWNWVRIDQLAMYVKLNIISAEEFEQICGEQYKDHEQ